MNLLASLFAAVRAARRAGLPAEPYVNVAVGMTEPGEVYLQVGGSSAVLTTREALWLSHRLHTYAARGAFAEQGLEVPS